MLDWAWQKKFREIDPDKTQPFPESNPVTVLVVVADRSSASQPDSGTGHENNDFSRINPLRIINWSEETPVRKI
jgi:hypothetical protein